VNTPTDIAWRECDLQRRELRAEVERLREYQDSLTAQHARHLRELADTREERDRVTARSKTTADVLDSVLRSMDELGEYDPVDDGQVIRNVIEALRRRG
jgi:uncharacterized coiled-coil DUF342 family protein